MHSRVLLPSESVSGKQEIHHSHVWETFLENIFCLPASLSVVHLDGVSLVP